MAKDYALFLRRGGRGVWNTIAPPRQRMLESPGCDSVQYEVAALERHSCIFPAPPGG
jgi:hypothetical protein